MKVYFSKYDVVLITLMVGVALFTSCGSFGEGTDYGVVRFSNPHQHVHEVFRKIEKSMCKEEISEQSLDSFFNQMASDTAKDSIYQINMIVHNFANSFSRSMYPEKNIRDHFSSAHQFFTSTSNDDCVIIRMFGDIAFKVGAYSDKNKYIWDRRTATSKFQKIELEVIVVQN